MLALRKLIRGRPQKSNQGGVKIDFVEAVTRTRDISPFRRQGTYAMLEAPRERVDEADDDAINILAAKHRSEVLKIQEICR